jgi:hypothetical protein
MSGQGPVPTAHALLVHRGAGVRTAPDGGAPGGVIRHSPPAYVPRSEVAECLSKVVANIVGAATASAAWVMFSAGSHVLSSGIYPLQSTLYHSFLHLILESNIASTLLCCFFHNLWRLGNQLFPSRNVIGMVRVQKGAVKDVVDLPLRG